MDAVVFLKERLRMLNAIGGCLSSNCTHCPLSSVNSGRGIHCIEFQDDYPEEAVAIVERWSQEHPRKKMLQDFLEKYPKAKLFNDGTPYRICPEDLGYCDEVDDCKPYTRDCVACWNRPLEE